MKWVYLIFFVNRAFFYNKELARDKDEDKEEEPFFL